MNLHDYIERLQTLVKEKPEVLEMEVIYSDDDEGNNFQKVNFGPTLGKADDLEQYNIEFASWENATSEQNECEENEINCICIN